MLITHLLLKPDQLNRSDIDIIEFKCQHLNIFTFKGYEPLTKKRTMVAMSKKVTTTKADVVSAF